MNLKEIIAPFYVWKRAFEKPYTTPNPIKERPGAQRYRGFHQNDMDKCIGCGTCESICQNAAIDMVPVEGIETSKQDSGLRPRIDYGRCCGCALCVDICTTDSLTMSNQYIWVDSDADVFRFIPGADKKDWDNDEAGYKTSEGYELLNPKREAMASIPGDESVKSFLEMIKGYSKEQAMKEAIRCVDCGICVASCPAHMDIPGYIKAIRDDDMEAAVKILYATNPLPGVCGRICTHRCEDVCSVGIKGDPLAIRWLKRYIVDQLNEDDIEAIIGDEFSDNGKKVAIIGAGPGGLSAAYYLNRLGYRVTIYEAAPEAGGMIRYGVPEYRMPYNDLDKDINQIIKNGVSIEYNKKVGKDIHISTLLEYFDALFFSTGLDIPYKMEIAGENLPGVVDGLSVLDQVTKGIDPELGSKVAVIGGGNVAMDAARTAKRFGADVSIIYRRREEDMPADQEEIEEAHDEQIKFITKAIPVEIRKGEDNALAFVWNNAEMVEQPDGGRPRPVAIDGDIESLEIDTVISAIGQGTDYSFLGDLEESLEFKRYKVLTDEYGQTSIKSIFAGGDIVNKTADAISAIADGHRAARGIDKYLQNRK